MYVRVALSLLLALLFSPLAFGAEEWHVSNAASVQGNWRIAEIEFYTDHNCTQAASVVPQSVHITPLPPTKVWKSDVLQDVKDCSAACDLSKTAYCSFCGEGNACCKIGAKEGECRDAIGFSTNHHQCVALAPKGPLTQQTVFRAFDKDPKTLFEAMCEREGDCPPGSLVLGTELMAGTLPVRCIVVVKPSSNSNARGSNMFRLLRNRRNPTQCPGLCRSGRYVENGGKGPCTEHLSLHGWCGSSSVHYAGIDCRGCSQLGGQWEVVGLPLVDMDMRPDGNMAVRFRERAPAVAAPVNAPATNPKRGLDCWGACKAKSGFCEWCGQGYACCKEDRKEDAMECKRAIGFTAKHHECVKISPISENKSPQEPAAQPKSKEVVPAAPPQKPPSSNSVASLGSKLQNRGADCWFNCNAKPGYCQWCGHGNMCCKRGDPKDPVECKQAIGFSTNHHECVMANPVTKQEHVEPPQVDPANKRKGVSLDIKNPGQDCWGPCKGKSGFCKWCGDGNACCKKGFAGDPVECQRALKFLTNHHECVGLFSVASDNAKGPAKVAEEKKPGTMRKDIVAAPVNNLAGKQQPDIAAGKPQQPVKDLSIPHQANIPSAHLGMDCWGYCRAGFCSWCGEGNACCKMGSASPAECQRAMNFTTKHHECVRLAAPVQQAGKDCWGFCGGKSGYCSQCGEGNACCKKGFPNDPSECSRGIGFRTNHHECVTVTAILVSKGTASSAALANQAKPQVGLPAKPPVASAVATAPSASAKGGKESSAVVAPPQQPKQNESFMLPDGVDCWKPCGGKSGYCPRCGDGRACCKKGAKDDSILCRRAVSFKTIFHECAHLGPPTPITPAPKAQATLDSSGASGGKLPEPAKSNSNVASASQPRTNAHLPPKAPYLPSGDSQPSPPSMNIPAEGVPKTAASKSAPPGTAKGEPATVQRKPIHGHKATVDAPHVDPVHTHKATVDAPFVEPTYLSAQGSFFTFFQESFARYPGQQIWLMVCIVSAAWGAACMGASLMVCRRGKKGCRRRDTVRPGRDLLENGNNKPGILADDDQERNIRVKRRAIGGREGLDGARVINSDGGVGSFHSMCNDDEDFQPTPTMKQARRPPENITRSFKSPTTACTPTSVSSSMSSFNSPTPLATNEEEGLDLEDIYDAKWG